MMAATIAEDPKARPGTCRICACSELAGCGAGCAWVDRTRTLCSQCLDAAQIAVACLDIMARVGPMLRPPAPLPVLAWEALPFEHQQVLVMACKRTAERAQDALNDEADDEAYAALIELQAVCAFLQDACPHELQDGDEPPSDLIIRLLKPHVGHRVVLQ